MESVLYVYRRCSHRGGSSPFELPHGVPSGMTNDDVTPLVLVATEDQKKIEIEALFPRRCSRIADQTQKRSEEQNLGPPNVGDEILLWKGEALNFAKMWLAFN